MRGVRGLPEELENLQRRWGTERGVGQKTEVGGWTEGSGDGQRGWRTIEALGDGQRCWRTD